MKLAGVESTHRHRTGWQEKTMSTKILHYRKDSVIRSFEQTGPNTYESSDKDFKSINAAKKESRVKHGLFKVAKVSRLPANPA